MSTALGEMIKRARTASGKTQEEVADHIGLTKSAVSQWETGETIPELESFVAFCVYTNASADDLLLHRDMDELLKQLVGIWKNLSSDGRDSLLGNANRILTKERPEPGPHNPFPRKPSPNQTNSKAVKKRR